jgi:hypothetical protein
MLKKSKMYYGRYSPRAEMLYEVDEADEDVKWMVYEIERLREKNSALRQRLGIGAEESEHPEEGS